MTAEEFKQSDELLYHGAAKNFTYDPTGEYNPVDTGGDGTTDFGTGFYTTDSPAQAESYSQERRKDKAIVYSFLPHEAKMLDVRNKDNPEENGVLPSFFVEAWLDHLEDYIKKPNFFSNANLADWARKGIAKRIQELFIDRVRDALKKGELVRIRTDKDGGLIIEGIFASDENGLIDEAFQEFMNKLGIDGMIYREGGEGSKREQLTGYVFYNPGLIDTWEGWQKRNE